MATVSGLPLVQRQASTTASHPLCVDLDGTLIHTDLLWECLINVLAKSPWVVVLLPLWLFRGRARVKYELARRAEIAVHLLPYNQELISRLQTEKSKGREIVLVTAADRKLAESVATFLGIFDGVLASSPNLNLKGEAKAKALIELYGERGFDYVGDSPSDLAVWAHCERAILVSNDWHLGTCAEHLATSWERLSSPRTSLFVSTIRSMRVYQWLKNSLVLVPVFVGHRWTDQGRFADAIWAFLSFSLAASAVYVINDLCDLQQDRQHPDKQRRPLASGQLPLLAGVVLVPLLLLGATLLASFLAPSYWGWLAGYFVATCAYTFRLKHMLMVDVATLAFLYTMRILAGGAATQIVVSPWLLGFSVFLFLSLAFVKRVSELLKTAKDSRAYKVSDTQLLSMMGVASGYLATLVLALYIHSADVEKLYRSPQLLWPICLVMVYWISRVWVLTMRGAIPHDPILFAVRDKASYACLGISSALIVAARFWR